MPHGTRSVNGDSTAAVTILVSRPATQLTDFLRVAADRQVRVIPFPLLTIEPIIDRYDPHDISSDLENCSWLLFTSANAADIYLGYLHEHQITLPAQVAVGVIGRKTAEMVERYGIRVSLCPTDEVAEGLLSEFLRSEPEQEKTIIVPAAERIRPVLIEGLTQAGFNARKLDIYRSVPTPRKLLPAIEDERIDYSCFLNSAAVATLP